MTILTMAKKKRSSPDEPHKLWTTGEIKKLVGVKSAKTVAKWIDDGTMGSVQLPGFRNRRVPAGDLRLFLINCGYTWALRELNILEGRPPDTDMPPPGPPSKSKAPRKK